MVLLKLPSLNASVQPRNTGIQPLKAQLQLQNTGIQQYYYNVKLTWKKKPQSCQDLGLGHTHSSSASTQGLLQWLLLWVPDWTRPHPWSLGTRCRCGTWPFSLTPRPEPPVWHCLHSHWGLFKLHLTVDLWANPSNTKYPRTLGLEDRPLKPTVTGWQMKKGVLRFP